MTTVYRRGRRWYVGIPKRAGGWEKRTTGTEDKALAKSMARMIDDLGPSGRREWELLEAVLADRLTVGSLFDAHSRNDLDGLRARLNDVDLNDYVTAWLAVLRASLAKDTVEHYELYVRSLTSAEQGFSRSELTFERISRWLSSRSVGPGTKRKYHAALSSFCEYLRATGVLTRNPVRDVKAPPPSRPRMQYLASLREIRALADAQAEPFRTLSLLLHATGIEVSVALGLKRRDLDVLRREIRARGTKTKSRDRIAKIAEWAWPDIERHIALLTPNALLFPGLNRWTASDKHRDACAALEIPDYQLRDARHSYAVRAVRAGASFEVVAQQLGHSDTTMVVRVYARFRPTDAERSGWEQQAAIQDAAREAL
jgi:integrase